MKTAGTISADGRNKTAQPSLPQTSAATQVPIAPAIMQASQAGKYAPATFTSGSPADLNTASNTGIAERVKGTLPFIPRLHRLTTRILALGAALAIQAAGAAEKSPAPATHTHPRFDPQKSYDLGSLVELGLALNPSTRAAYARAEAAQATIGQERSPYYPQITAGVRTGWDQWYTPATVAPDYFTRRQNTAVLALEYLLLDFGRRSSDVARAIALFDAAGLLFERKVQEVVFEIQSRYFAHESALWKEQAAAAMVEFARTAMETIDLESRNGLAAAPDVLRARKELLDSQYELENARALARNTLGELLVATGLPADTPLRLAKNELPANTGSLRSSAATLIQAAFASRPDLAARAADVRAAEASTDRAAADFLPKVTLEGNYAYSAFQYDSQTGSNKRDNVGGVNGFAGFLNVEWDIFDGFERVENLRKRRAEELAAREELQSLRLAASRDVWTAYHDSLSASRRVEFAEGYVASANENFEAVRTAYTSGLAPVTELSDSAAQLALARSARADAVADYSTTLAALALAIGSVR